MKGPRDGDKDSRDNVAHAMGAAPARAYVDGETQKYFLELSNLMDEITDDEEFATLCSNAMVETSGKELKLSCHPSCSRTLEKLLTSSDVTHTLSFIEQCHSVFAAMANDPSGSHVAEAALKSLARALEGNDNELYESVGDSLDKLCKVLHANAVDMMRNRYGSHVLRSLLCLLSGHSFENDNKKPLSKKLSSNQSNRANFPSLLKLFTSELLLASKSFISELRCDTFASPVLQAVLKALEGDEKTLTQTIAVLMECDKEGEALESIKAENMLEVVEDRNGSHLMEVILEMAPDAVYLELFERVFSGNLIRLSLHHFSNFVIQRLVASARQSEQINAIVKELESSFAAVIEKRRAGVIASLLAACAQFNTNQREVCRALSQAINPKPLSTVSLVPRLLHLDSYTSFHNSDAWTPDSDSPLSLLGCGMLQTIFGFTQEYSQQFVSSFASMEVKEIIEAVTKHGGSRVMERYLVSSLPVKQKCRVIAKLEGHFAELAMNNICYYVVDKCYSVANIRLKEVIASELVKVQSELSKAKHGNYLLKKFNVGGFAKNVESWRLKERSKQGARDAFSDIIENDDDGQKKKMKKKKKKKKRKREEEDEEEEEGKGEKVSGVLDGIMLQLGVNVKDKKKKQN